MTNGVVSAHGGKFTDAREITESDEIVVMENCRFSTEIFWRLVFSHEWFIIHLQRDEVELEMNSEPRV